ncbi:PD-(D/E)XK nuclease-like domain-containing protein [Spirosoma sp. RP8]|uniref:PD-(D/E)XK nuclease-like domain-containing protein n=1 Tax=Spirosoma liriopis TaxID=2937440 RepID=A0ABT0HUH2_9BACT|nr:PD-(D/E)XK nuclease-like domain-containing protein [Spirosoma liriopis]MCK8495844.1 PD-(D/E)XK nuclease-like domain-containing protein [Spirosoma liriopis]
MDYRSLPRISNSDLTEFKNRIFGYRPYQPASALAFGSALHELILEPNTNVNMPESVDRNLLNKVAEQVQADAYCRWALQFSRKESVQLWKDPATGLLLKSKLDLVHRNRLVIDFKSTSQRTHADFLKSLHTYDYDRQAAFYLDSVNAHRFVFIGVQKIKPYNIWIVEPPACFVETGRKKYRALLREWKRRQEAGQPFTPSSWNREPVLNPAVLCS